MPNFFPQMHFPPENYLRRMAFLTSPMISKISYSDNVSNFLYWEWIPDGDDKESSERWSDTYIAHNA